MRTTSATVFGFLAIMLLFQSCSKDKCTTTQTYQVYEPVYMDYEEFRSSVASETPRSLDNPGKIYIFGAYLYINEVNKGVHVIDNSNPHNPVSVAFINIPGNVDIAVQNGILYADSYTDLLALDISNPSGATVTKRLENIFPQRAWEYYGADPEKGIVIDWVKTDKTDTYEIDCETKLPLNGQYPYPYYYAEGDVRVVSAFTPNSDGANGASASNPSGQGGSMARFAVGNRYLYAVDNSDLQLVDISTNSNPTLWNKTNIGFNIETIFPYQDKLFIGSQTGMYIYNVANPSSPQFISQYTHIRSCDPVVVEGNYAYVTLRSGTVCQGFTNQLDVIDITNLSSLQLVKSYSMYNPHGLGIANGTLFICDGDAGLKVFNASNVNTIDQNLLKHFGDIHAYDVIPYNDVLIMIGTNGLYQYDYSDIQNIQLISQIPVI